MLTASSNEYTHMDTPLHQPQLHPQHRHDDCEDNITWSIHPSISISASSQYVVHRYMDTPHPRSQPLLPSDPSDSATTTSLSRVSSESPSILWSGHICWGCFWQLSYLITLFIMQYWLWILDIALDIGPILSYYSTDLLWIIRMNLEVRQRPV